MAWENEVIAKTGLNLLNTFDALQETYRTKEPKTQKHIFHHNPEEARVPRIVQALPKDFFYVAFRP
jgi:hypothetical protein